MAWSLMAGLQKAQNTAREAHTKATIAKLNHFITLKMSRTRCCSSLLIRRG